MKARVYRLGGLGLTIFALCVGIWFFSGTDERKKMKILQQKVAANRIEISNIKVDVRRQTADLGVEKIKIKCGTIDCGTDGSCYVIRSGDTLSQISENMYGNWKFYLRIAEVNNIADPDMIYAGNHLCIPDMRDGAHQTTRNFRVDPVAVSAGINSVPTLLTSFVNQVKPIQQQSSSNISDAVWIPNFVGSEEIAVNRSENDVFANLDFSSVYADAVLPEPTLFALKDAALALPTISQNWNLLLPTVLTIKNAFSAKQEKTLRETQKFTEFVRKNAKPLKTIIAVLLPRIAGGKNFPAAYIEQRGKKKLYREITLTALDEGAPILTMRPPQSTRFGIAVIPADISISETIVVVEIGEDTILPPYNGRTDESLAAITDSPDVIQKILEGLRPHGWQEPDPKHLKKAKHLKRQLGQKPSWLNQMLTFAGYRGLSTLPMLALNANPIVFGTSMGTSVVQSAIQRRIMKHRERISVHTENLSYASRIAKQQEEIRKLKAQISKKHERESMLLLRLAVQSAEK